MDLEREKLLSWRNSNDIRSLKTYLDGLDAGAIVIVSIADTACAKSRPLGKGVYEALTLIGAAANMEPILYRQAWALIGFKGAEPGTAVTAMGKRSTLLRLEATFAFREGAVVIESRKEDQTSIIEVVTGGGQDTA